MEPYTRNGGIIGKVMDFGATDFYGGEFDPNTKLVMNFNDTNSSTNFVDSTSTVTFPTVVGATVSTTQSKYGGSSGYFNGSSYIASTYSADLVFGTNPFTIEAWIYSPSGQNTGSNHTIICVAEAQSATNWQFNITNGYLYFYFSTSAISNTTTLIPTNQWVHVAAVREGTGTNQFKLYLNGTLWATGTNSVNYSYNVGLRLGMNRGSNAYFNGYIDDVRIVNGTALYTTNFTPPSEIVSFANRKNSGIWDLHAVFESISSVIPLIEVTYDSNVDFAVATTDPRGPTIPNTVDDTYIGVLLEYTATLSSDALPSGWTSAGILGTTSSSPSISVSYKKLDIADIGTSPGRIVGGNQRDQLYLFRVTGAPITTLSAQNVVFASTTGDLTSTAPTINSSQAAIAIHYFYNSSTATPPVTSSPSMTLLRSSVNNYHGGQYRIVNPGEAIQDQTAGATLAGTIRQGLLWLVIN